MALSELLQANNGFLPHGYCLLWKPGLLWTLVGSDLLIALSYFSIPLALVWLLKKQPALRFRGIFLMFGAFITACGVTHLMEIANIWRPMYATTAGLKVFTALVSLMTATVLWFLVPKASAFIDKHRRLQEELPARNQELQRALHQARASEKSLRLTQSAAPIGIATVSTEGLFMTVNTALADMLGYSEAQLTALTFQQITHPEDLETDLAYVHALLEGQRDSYRMDKRYFHHHGHTIHVQLDVSIVRDENGTPLHFISMIQDITQQKLNELALRRSRTKFKKLLENLPTAVVLHHTDGSVEYGNPAAKRLLGMSQADKSVLLNHNWRLVDEDQQVLEVDQFPVPRVIATGRPIRDATLGIDHPNQAKPTWVKVDAFTMPGDQGDDPQIVVAFTDITERKALQDKLSLQARTDALTGLFNRRHCMDELDIEFARALRFEQDLSVIMIDLDHFKQINDSQGHQVGDQVLRVVGDTLRQMMRTTDIAARIGGEEFVLLLPQISAKKALEAAQRLRLELQRKQLPLPSGETLNWTVSIGVATLHASDITPADFMRRADEALYVAKERGRNRVQMAAQPLKRNVRRLSAKRRPTAPPAPDAED